MVSCFCVSSGFISSKIIGVASASIIFSYNFSSLFSSFLALVVFSSFFNGLGMLTNGK